MRKKSGITGIVHYGAPFLLSDVRTRRGGDGIEQHPVIVHVHPESLSIRLDEVAQVTPYRYPVGCRLEVWSERVVYAEERVGQYGCCRMEGHEVTIATHRVARDRR